MADERVRGVKKRGMKRETRVALVTGGAQGIGKGIVAYLLRHHWRVVFMDCDDRAGQLCLRDLGGNGGVCFLPGDVSQEESVQQVVTDAYHWGGRLDALINNAGIAKAHSGPIEQLRLEDWERWLAVNLTGPMLMTKHAAPYLRESKGAIVNIASTRALQSEPDSEAYAASKGGLVALTHACAVSLGPDIRVNAISPGWIDVRAWQADADEPVPPLSEQDHQQHPAGRVGKPEDIASLVHYLISPESSFVTGQNFVVDGGMTRKMIYAE